MKTAALLASIVALLCACDEGASGPATTAPPKSPEPEPTDDGEPALAFSLEDGLIKNYFFRQGDVAAHVVVTSGTAPRIIVAFPAGNSGIGLWFEDVDEAAALEVAGKLEPVHRDGELRGVTMRFRVEAPKLSSAPPVMSSIRVLRDFASTRKLPPELSAAAKTAEPLAFSRQTLDGNNRFELALEPVGKTRVETTAAGNITWHAPKEGGPIEFSLTALHTDPPLTPIARGDILIPEAEAAADPALLNALAFLSYEEKLCAGSWRFLTYFGRDTLLSVRLLMPVLEPAVIEGALGSVIDRLSRDGAVAHEEDIGEFAALRHLREDGKPERKPIYDYKMVDDDFLLAPVLAHYLLDTEAGKARAAEFLARETPSGMSYRDAVKANLGYVLKKAKPYAPSGGVPRLIALKEGEKVGGWRDSEAGLGGGRISYNINAALVPAAVKATGRLYQSQLLGPDRFNFAKKAGMFFETWKDAGKHFTVKLSAKVAARRIEAYAKAMGIPVPSQKGDVSFPALALDAKGKPLPIMHSDDGFVLLFLEPDDQALAAIAHRITAPFPRGLMTPVGVVVANPAYAANKKLREMFGKDAYHGAVIWSWQQAMLAAGLARQLERDDLAAETRKTLETAQAALWKVIAAADDIRAAEHWTWAYEDGEYRVARFGTGDDTEANAAQLWSTVYLAVKPPAGR